MRIIFRAVAIGLLAGLALFFVPFLFRFFLFALVIWLIVRFFFRRRWYGRYGYMGGCPPAPYSNDASGNFIVPIDRQGYTPPVQGKGPEISFPVQ